ncbi:ATP-binding protein [Pseudovibrio sp. POLY-S9]|uniref:ATP-binding protein n=1 Tax=Pseudovibrio sp. POLY-S9 TaxID=1576596 RepID=UPI0007109C1F|nr:ATP-binding protein [Pseudovibrio sp. POLY-S9]
MFDHTTVRASNGSIAAGRDVIINIFLKRVPTGYQSQIDDFVRSYLGSDERPVPFGGREKEFQELSEWLSSTTQKCLMTAPAGRGKSALLIHWLFAEEFNRDIGIVFVPISTRFSTNRPAIFLEIFAKQLADLLEEELDAPETHRDIYYISRIKECLRRADDQGKRLLIVMDGLDEAVGFNNWNTILPVGEFPNIKILFSARITATKNTDGWLRVLRWETISPAVLRVPRLSDGNIANLVLDTLSVHVENVADFIGEICRISEGDPLICNFILSDVLCSDDPILKLNNLSNIDAGFGGYFASWINDLNLTQKIEYILLIVASAFAPISIRDLEVLVSKLTGSEIFVSDGDLRSIDRVLMRVSGNRYLTLNHPKFAQYILDEHFYGSGIVRAGQQAFFEYAKDEVESAGEVSPYLLGNYRIHLEEYDCGLTEAEVLLIQNWRNSQLESSLRHASYASDLNVAWKVAEKEYFERKSINEEQFCSFVCKCALALSSISSLSNQIPTDIFSQAIEIGIIPVDYAIEKIDRFPKDNRLDRKIDIFQHLPDSLRNAIIAEIDEMEASSSKMSRYLRLVDHVDSQRVEVIKEKCHEIFEQANIDDDAHAEQVRRFGEQYRDYAPAILKLQLTSQFLNTFDDIELANEALPLIDHYPDPISRAGTRLRLSVSAGIAVSGDLIDAIIADLNAEKDRLRVGRCVCGFLYSHPELLTDRFLTFASQLINDLISRLQPRLGIDQFAGNDFCDFFAGNLFIIVAKAIIAGRQDDIYQQYPQIIRNLSMLPAYHASTACANMSKLVEGELHEKLIDLAFEKCEQQPTANNRTFSYAQLANAITGHSRYEEAIRLSFAAAEEVDDYLGLFSWKLSLLQEIDGWPSNSNEWLSEVDKLQDHEHKCTLYLKFLKASSAGAEFDRCKALFLAEVSRSSQDRKIRHYLTLIDNQIIEQGSAEFGVFLQSVRDFLRSMQQVGREAGIFDLRRSLHVLQGTLRNDVVTFLFLLFVRGNVSEYLRISGSIDLLRYANERQKVILNQALNAYFANSKRDNTQAQHAFALYQKTGEASDRDRLIALLPALSMCQAAGLYKRLLDFEGVSIKEDRYNLWSVILELNVLENEELASKTLIIEIGIEDQEQRLKALFDLLSLHNGPNEKDHIFRCIFEQITPDDEDAVSQIWDLLKENGKLTLGEKKLAPIIRERNPILAWNDLLHAKSMLSRSETLRFLSEEANEFPCTPNIRLLDDLVSDVVNTWP